MSVMITQLSEASMLINDEVDVYKNQSTSPVDLQSIIVETVSDIIANLVHDQNSNSLNQLSLYLDFYRSTIENVNLKLNDDVSMIRTKYLVLQDLVSLQYIIAAHYIRTNDLETAANLCEFEVSSIMEGHNFSRAVLTMSARNNVSSPYKGWFIGRAVKIVESNRKLNSLFFHDEKSLTRYLCQVDFMQYLFEYMRSQDIFYGYPNFLFFSKKNIADLIQKLEEREEYNKVKYSEVLRSLTTINGGEFFGGNVWRNEK